MDDALPEAGLFDACENIVELCVAIVYEARARNRDPGRDCATVLTNAKVEPAERRSIAATLGKLGYDQSIVNAIVGDNHATRKL